MSEEYNFNNVFKEHWQKLVLREKNRREMEIRNKYSVILLSDNTIL